MALCPGKELHFPASLAAKGGSWDTARANEFEAEVEGRGFLEAGCFFFQRLCSVWDVGVMAGTLQKRYEHEDKEHTWMQVRWSPHP